MVELVDRLSSRLSSSSTITSLSGLKRIHLIVGIGKPVAVQLNSTDSPATVYIGTGC